jgi:anti-anti-sigma factor
VEKILEVEVSRRPGHALVVARGEIDYSAARTLREALRNAVALHEDSILVDLTAVGYMDSSGVYALLEAWREGGGRPDFLRLKVGDSPAARVLQLAGVDQLMDVEEELAVGRA